MESNNQNQNSSSPNPDPKPAPNPEVKPNDQTANSLFSDTKSEPPVQISPAPVEKKAPEPIVSTPPPPPPPTMPKAPAPIIPRRSNSSLISGIIVVAVLALLIVAPKIQEMMNNNEETSNEEETEQVATTASVPSQNNSISNSGKTLTRAEALVKYANKKLEITGSCSIAPHTLSQPRGTTILLDNNTNKYHTMTVGKKTYRISPYHYTLSWLNVSPGTLSVTCDGKNEGATVIVR